MVSSYSSLARVLRSCLDRSLTRPIRHSRISDRRSGAVCPVRLRSGRRAVSQLARRRRPFSHAASGYLVVLSPIRRGAFVPRYAPARQLIIFLSFRPSSGREQEPRTVRRWNPDREPRPRTIARPASTRIGVRNTATRPGIPGDGQCIRHGRRRWGWRRTPCPPCSALPPLFENRRRVRIGSSRGWGGRLLCRGRATTQMLAATRRYGRAARRRRAWTLSSD